MGERHARCDRKGGVWYTADYIELSVGEATPHCFRDTMQDVWVRDNHTQVNVNRRDETTLQLELAKFDGLEKEKRGERIS